MQWNTLTKQNQTLVILCLWPWNIISYFKLNIFGVLLFQNGLTAIRSLSTTPHLCAEQHARFFPAKTTPMLPKGCFEGKVAFVTGGGTGLGQGMAHMLSELGAEVAIVSR